MDRRLEAAPMGLLETRPDGAVTAVSDRAATLLDVDPDRSEGRSIGEVFPESIDNSVPDAFEDGLSERKTVEQYYPGLDRWLEVTLAPVGESVVVYLQNVTGRHERERENEQLRGDLDRLTITNRLISDILAALVDASTREEIAATICERLGETDIYEFAWVGERELGGDELAIRASAGTTGRTLEQIGDCLDDGVAPPEQRVIETGTPEIVQPLGGKQSVPESIRRAAFADGLQSLLAIPLTYGSNVYGVVGIYSNDQDAFSERERASFGTVGEMAGFAINAARHRNQLLSDTLVELTLEITDENAPLVAASAASGELVLDGTVPQGSELLCYVTVTDRSPEAVAESLTEVEGVTAARVIGEYDTGGSLELRLAEETPLGLLATQGAAIQHAEYQNGHGECVIELSPAEDVRRVAEAVTREYEGGVVAKRQRERELATSREFRDELSDRLTDRQQNALRTAFFAEYFQSPRGSSAEEVADALGITGPTLLYHLRAGQRKLLSEFFDATDDGPRE